MVAGTFTSPGIYQWQVCVYCTGELTCYCMIVALCLERSVAVVGRWKDGHMEATPLVLKTYVWVVYCMRSISLTCTYVLSPCDVIHVMFWMRLSLQFFCGRVKGQASIIVWKEGEPGDEASLKALPHFVFKYGERVNDVKPYLPPLKCTEHFINETSISLSQFGMNK